MKRTILKTLSCVAMVAITISFAPQALAQATKGYNHPIPEKIMTPDKVETSIGTLNFFDVMPDKDTVTKVYDNLDLMRGVEAFLNGLPMPNLEAVRAGLAEQGDTAFNKPIILDTLADSDPLWLTPTPTWSISGIGLI